MPQRILNTGNEILTERSVNKVPRNSFGFNHDCKMSCNIGELIPIMIQEALPGDILHFQTQGLVRLQPMIFPVLHRMKVRTETFFCPYRLLWPNWETFISPVDEGTTPPAMPFLMPDTAMSVGMIGDYLGIPAPIAACPKINALVPAAYTKIYTDWYCDEDLNDGDNIFTPLQDGDNSGVSPNYVTGYPYIRNYDRDYFTSAKPWAQKGDAVVIPLVNVASPGLPVSWQDSGTPPDFSDLVGGIPTAGNLEINSAGIIKSSGDTLTNLSYQPNGTLFISVPDITNSAALINDLRLAEALQVFLESDSRGGTRYIETIKQHWDVESSDARLQRSEYICSSTQVVTISEVLQTSESDTTPQANMAGHGIAVPGHEKPMHYHAEEYGVFITLASCLPDTGYYQGIHPMFRRFDRLDYPWPEFAQLGEQTIKNGEVWYDDTDPGYTGVNAEDWGYLPRYSEYRLPISRVAGDFKASLDSWHMARKFASLPSLSGDFLRCSNNTALERIFAVTDPTVDHLLMHWFHSMSIDRKLPRLVRPGI